MDAIERDINEAEATVTRLRAELAQAERDRDALYIERSTEKYGIKIGDKVKNGTRVGIVESIFPNAYRNARPNLFVYLFKQDGTVSKRITTFFDWEKVT